MSVLARSLMFSLLILLRFFLDQKQLVKDPLLLSSFVSSALQTVHALFIMVLVVFLPNSEPTLYWYRIEPLIGSKNGGDLHDYSSLVCFIACAILSVFEPVCGDNNSFTSLYWRS
jgi:hypothetical protein